MYESPPDDDWFVRLAVLVMVGEVATNATLGRSARLVKTR